MPGEVIGEALSGVFRFVFRMFAEVIFEFLIKGVGFIICRPFSKKISQDDFIVTIIGIFVWGIIIFCGYQLMSFIDVDSCLDSGGRYDYQLNECEHGEE